MARRKRRRPRPPRIDPYIQQAELESLVRFGPERSALAELLREAKSSYKTGVQQQRASASSYQRALREAAPNVRRIYEGQRQTPVAEAQLRSDLTGLGPSADRFKAVIAGESAAAVRRREEAERAALAELEQRKTSATQGAAYATRQLGEQYRQDVGQIGRQRRALAAQEGAFTLATVNDLRAAAQKAAVDERKFREQIRQFNARMQQGEARLDLTRRGQDITVRGQDIGRQNALDRARGGGRGGLTPTQRRNFRNQYFKAIGMIETGKDKRGVRSAPRLRADPRRWGPGTAAGLEAKGIPHEIAKAAVWRVASGASPDLLRRQIRHRYGFWVHGFSGHRRPRDRTPPVLRGLGIRIP